MGLKICKIYNKQKTNRVNWRIFTSPLDAKCRYRSDKLAAGDSHWISLCWYDVTKGLNTSDRLIPNPQENPYCALELLYAMVSTRMVFMTALGACDLKIGSAMFAVKVAKFWSRPIKLLHDPHMFSAFSRSCSFAVIMLLTTFSKSSLT